MGGPHVRKEPTTALCHNLIELYDDFVRFHDRCAFFADAMNGLLSEQSETDYGCLEGARDFSEQVKAEVAALKRRLRELQESCCKTRCASPTPR